MARSINFVLISFFFTHTFANAKPVEIISQVIYGSDIDDYPASDFIHSVHYINLLSRERGLGVKATVDHHDGTLIINQFFGGEIVPATVNFVGESSAEEALDLIAKLAEKSPKKPVLLLDGYMQQHRTQFQASNVYLWMGGANRESYRLQHPKILQWLIGSKFFRPRNMDNHIAKIISRLTKNIEGCREGFESL